MSNAFEGKKWQLLDDEDEALWNNEPVDFLSSQSHDDAWNDDSDDDDWSDLDDFTDER